MVACAGPPRAYVPTVPDSVMKRVEGRELPPDPATESLPEGLPAGDWVEPIEKGECLDDDGTPDLSAPRPCPLRSGIAVSEERAYRDGLFRARYRELRENYKADRMVWGAHRELYETRLEAADKVIQNLQPNWWDRNKLQLGLVGGVVLGIATTIAVLAVTEEIRE